MPETPPGLDAFAADTDKRVQSAVRGVFGMIAKDIQPLIREADTPYDLANRITLDWPVSHNESLSLVDSLQEVAGLPAKYFMGNTPLNIIDKDRLAWNQRDWARRHAAETVSNLSWQTQQTLGRSLSRAMAEGADLDTITMRFRRYIGLDDRYAQAVDNYKNGLIKGGKSRGEADRLSRSYAARLRTSRARRIAQTEHTTALWEGQQQYWDELQRQGVVDPNRMRKRWRTHKDEKVCPVCRPLHNFTIPWDGKFVLPKFGAYVSGPPAHPNCRCEVTVLWSRYVVSKYDPAGV